jgi:hypothetical protein
VKKQLVVFQRKNVCQNETSNLLGQLDKNFLGGLPSRIQFVAFAFGKATHVLNDKFCWKKLDHLLYYI